MRGQLRFCRVFKGQIALVRYNQTMSDQVSH